MREILKEVVNEQGLQILQTPAMLRAKLEEKGDDRSDALLWELILTACPSVADVAVQPELSRAEVNTVIGAVTKTTMLSASPQTRHRMFSSQQAARAAYTKR